jgi:diguanylate cyclase (GGDEF)-like protein
MRTHFFQWLRNRPIVLGLLTVCAIITGAAAAIGLGIPALWSSAVANTLPSWLSVTGLFAVSAALFTGLVAGVVAWFYASSWKNEKQNVNRLSALQSQYGLAEDLALLGSWVYHVAENRYDWSAGTYTVFGINPENGVPSPRGFLICIHPDDQERWKAANKRAIRKASSVRIEYRYIKNGKDTIHVRSVARCETDKQGRVVRLAGIVQDISANRAMANQLARSEAKFRDLSQISSDWFWETDIDHKLCFISDSAASEMGPWIRQSLGKTRWELSDPHLPGTDWNSFKATLDSHKPFNDFVYGRIDPDGNLHYLSIGGRPLFDDNGVFKGYRGVGRAITREREQQLLLEIENDMTKIMREQVDPDRVVALTMLTVCNIMGWVGAINLQAVSGANAFKIGESWGDSQFLQMVNRLENTIALTEGSIEAASWTTAKALWARDFTNHPEFAERYSMHELGLKAVFMAPIVDENEQVMSALLMFCKVPYVADRFIEQMAGILSRNLSLFLQRKAAEKRLTRASLHDALTGMPNRIYLVHQLESKLKRSEAVAVLYVDLDRFKIINDTLGHQVGDQVLIEVTKRTTEALREEDVVGRIGGDEFIILLSNLDDPDEIEKIARKVLAALEKPFVFSGKAYFLSGSIGVAIAPRDGTDSKLLIKCADSAMYQVKSEGRNDIRFFSADLSDDRTEQLQLAAELPMALKEGQVSLHYQPILDIEQRCLVGMEGLIRWQHPTRGLLMPDQFLPIAEQSNLIREIGIWTIRRAIEDRITLGLAQFQDAPVSVNISAKQLSEDGFLDLVRNTLFELKFPAHLLRLELSESSFIQDPQRTQGLISGLRGLGVSVIIDNFGTGYASLSYIKSLPVDGIKIDQVFIRDLARDRGNAAIVQAIQTLAKQMEMAAMAEGVETAEELRALRYANCTVVQGTFISPPLPIEGLKEFVESIPMMRDLHTKPILTEVKTAM